MSKTEIYRLVHQKSPELASFLMWVAPEIENIIGFAAWVLGNSLSCCLRMAFLTGAKCL